LPKIFHLPMTFSRDRSCEDRVRAIRQRSYPTASPGETRLRCIWHFRWRERTRHGLGDEVRGAAMGLGRVADSSPAI